MSQYKTPRDVYFALRAEFPALGASRIWVLASLWPKFGSQDKQGKALQDMRKFFRECYCRLRIR